MLYETKERTYICTKTTHFDIKAPFPGTNSICGGLLATPSAQTSSPTSYFIFTGSCACVFPITEVKLISWLYQFESIFELVKISNNKVRTLVLSGLTPRPLFGHCQNFGEIMFFYSFPNSSYWTLKIDVRLTSA